MATAPPLEPTARSAGVLMHVTSLPNDYDVGDLGPAAHRWIDALADAGQTWWQTLPLNPPDGSDSPYSASSSLAGNALLISPALLAEDGLLTRKELAEFRVKGSHRVDFAKARAGKTRMLTLAADRIRSVKALARAYDRFIADESAWLDDYALFAALRERAPETPWSEWPRGLVRREPRAIEQARAEVVEAFERHRVAQFLFDRQMRALREHARTRGIKILGDVPIYLSIDSADCWANRHFFQLDARGRPTAVAGVPPDLFSADGQRWGNPLYDWDTMAADKYRWWIARFRATLRHADVARIDHFRGLAAYWRIPAKAPTARRGKWVEAPGDAMLRAVAAAFKGMPLVAEDLGLVTPDVEKLRDDWGLAGMQIIEFGFGGDSTNKALPHNHVRNQIVYPGNHDNDTCVGWWRSAEPNVRKHALRYLPDLARDPAGELIRCAMASIADRAIIQVQDVLGLDTRARMNFPGTSGPSNWTWRMSPAAYRDRGWKRLAELTEVYGRTRPTADASN